MRKRIFSNWRVLWPLQALLLVLNSLAATFLPLFFPQAVTVLRVVFLWILPSVLGALSACMLTRAGLISYAAWVIPPIVHSIIPWLTLGYPPPPATMLLCALSSLVGAATGDVLSRSKSS